MILRVKGGRDAHIYRETIDCYLLRAPTTALGGATVYGRTSRMSSSWITSSTLTSRKRSIAPASRVRLASSIPVLDSMAQRTFLQPPAPEPFDLLVEVLGRVLGLELGAHEVHEALDRVVAADAHVHVARLEHGHAADGRLQSRGRRRRRRRHPLLTTASSPRPLELALLLEGAIGRYRATFLCCGSCLQQSTFKSARA